MKYLIPVVLLLVTTPLVGTKVLAGSEPAPFEIESAKARADLKRAEAAVAVARANLEMAELNFKRAAALLQKGGLPPSDYDAAQSAYEMAKATLAVEKANFGRAKAALRRRSGG
jgi:HlyD family secretion protein